MDWQFDFSMQRAIFASLQMHHAAHRAAVSSFVRGSEGLRPAVHRAPSTGQYRSAACNQAVPRSDRSRAIEQPPPAGGRPRGERGACAREGILPTLPSTPARRGAAAAPSRPSLQPQAAPSHGEGASAASNKGTAKPVGRTTAQAPLSPLSAAMAPSGEPADKFEAEIERDIIGTSPQVQWEDVVAQADAKRLLNEAVVLPLLVPELFVGLRTPWRGVLLYGPPGTGKTLLGKAVATCGKTKFFNVSAASLLSRYHGESEKMVRALFRCARRHAPSTVFIDEVDAIMRSRGAGDEHEASRRLKAELLQQMDGIATGAPDEPRVLVLCTTNTPWDLDDALIRRLEKRIYVPLPDLAGRHETLALQLTKMCVEPGVDAKVVSEAMPAYSGADIVAVCREASMRPMRRLVEGKSPSELVAMKEDGTLQHNSKLLAVTEQDFRDAIAAVQPSVDVASLGQFDDWAAKHGSA